MSEWILSSSVLILFVLLLRFLLKKRLDPRLRYALWLLVLLRLLFPLPFFESALNLTDLAERAVESRTGTAFLPPEEYVSGAGAPLLSQPEQAENTPGEASAGPEQASRLRPLLLGFWAAGAAVLLLCAGVLNRRFARQLRRGARPLPGIWTVPPRQIYISPAPGTPCLFGLLPPAIYVSEALAVDDRALGHALSHERAHYRHGDPVWALLRLLALALHWYNPLVWLACRLSRQDAEAAADASAVDTLGEKERLDYGETLLRQAAAEPGPRSALTLGTTLFSSRRWLKERLRLILRRPRTALPALLLLLFCVPAAVRLTYAGAVREREPAPPPASAAPLQAEQPAPLGQRPLVSLYYNGQLYLQSYSDSVVSGPMSWAARELGSLVPASGETPRREMEVDDERYVGLSLWSYRSPSITDALCVEYGGALQVFEPYLSLSGRQRARAEILASEEAFTACLRESLTDWGTAFSPEAYAAAFPQPLFSAPQASEFQPLGSVFVRQDPPGSEELFVIRIFYSYRLGAAILVDQRFREREDSSPAGAPWFITARTNEAGEPLSETHPWAYFQAYYCPEGSDGPLTFTLYAANPMEEDLCLSLLTAFSGANP